MANFRYKAVTAAGAITTGLVEAHSQTDAVARIRGLGHLPLATAPAREEWWRPFLPEPVTRRRSAAAIAFATQELAALLGARLPLDRALSILAELEETRSLRKPIQAILGDVRGGASLADAIDATGVFPKSYVTIVRAGEHGGNLEGSLKRLSDYLARASAVRNAVVSAMIYPIALLATAVFSVMFILTYVLPEFAPLFAQSGKSLPWATQAALDLGETLRDFWWLIAIGAALIFLLFRRLAAAPAFRHMRDKALLKIPVVGDLLLKTQVERFSRMLGTLLTNDVALPQALQVVRDTLTNSVMADAVGETAARLKEGEPLAARLRQTGVFPTLALDMVRVGEETGLLDEMLLKQAELYEHEVRHGVDRLLALLVPITTIVMGIVVASLIASILVAILSINDLAT